VSGSEKKVFDASEISFDRIIDNLYDGLYFVDCNRVITYWNRAAERITGYRSDEVVGSNCKDNILNHVDGGGVNLCLNLCPLAATISDGTPREANVYLHHKDGHRVPVSVRVSPLFDNEGNVIGGVEVFTDLSGMENNHLRIRELERLAMLDPLTQLANRRYLEHEIHARLEENKRFGTRFGVLFMDIDHFKELNDTYGHDIGDRALELVAHTLVYNSRPFDLYGRWGGEEFIGIIRSVDEEELKEIGNRTRALIASSYIDAGDSRVELTISVGATLVREGDTVDDMLKRADALMYESKRAGRNITTVG
jgi:diguanylate cyclase (GGDEF)-like protein/PAS domain S-box-containing protein